MADQPGKMRTHMLKMVPALPEKMKTHMPKMTPLPEKMRTHKLKMTPAVAMLPSRLWATGSL